ncbi:integrin alpha-6 [Striga asiatica]|uniref:Integrin alpha-6 n=1 Tax=Striga asiatica TaxID=4170 RepID=A0A5A7P421_STRAF|nr:integrin alpha-6 [Striga asiatica]
MSWLDLRHLIIGIFFHRVWIIPPPPLPFYVLSTLANLGDVSATESLSVLGKGPQVNVFRERGLAKAGFEDLVTGVLIRKGDVNQLVKTARTKKGRVDNVRPVSGTNYEDSLFGIHAIHFGQKLVKNTICRSTSITYTASSLCTKYKTTKLCTNLSSNGVELVKEENARSRLTSLVEYFANISFTLSKPHEFYRIQEGHRKGHPLKVTCRISRTSPGAPQDIAQSTRDSLRG